MSSTEVLVDIEGEKPISIHTEVNQSVNKPANDTSLDTSTQKENIAIHTDVTGVAQSDWKGRRWRVDDGLSLNFLVFIITLIPLSFILNVSFGLLF